MEYDTVGALINQSQPTWDEARDMVDSEQQRQASRAMSDKNTVLINTATDRNDRKNAPPFNPNRSPYPNGYRGENYDPVKAARGRGFQTMTRGQNPNNGNFVGGRDARNSESMDKRYVHGGNSRGRGQYAHNGPPHFQNNGPYPIYNHHGATPYPNRPYPPPSPYPSQAHNYQAHLHTQAQMHGPPGSTSGYNALEYSDIGAALSNINLNHHDPQWYMDTGASSHITADSGSQGWTPPFPSQ